MHFQVDFAEALSDEQVVSRVLEGEVELFELLVRRHGARLYRAALFILRDDAEAEDAVQDTYLNAYSHLAQFAGRSRFSTWLLHIAMNNAWERIRRRKREIPTDIEDPKFQNLPCSVPDPETHLRRRELSSLIAAELALMPPQYRLVLLLRDFWGIDTREAARRLQISESNVKVRLHRARRVLRHQLAGKECGARWLMPSPGSGDRSFDGRWDPNQADCGIFDSKPARTGISPALCNQELAGTVCLPATRETAPNREQRSEI